MKPSSQTFRPILGLTIGFLLGASGPAGLSMAQSPGTFTVTGSMTTPRVGHTATLLPNGKVLIAGGGIDAESSAEIYDPATGRFTSTGEMWVPRIFHTATLLPDERVLIAGGNAGTTAELYDPASGTFTITGRMTAARYGHKSTLLADGRVLIVGGETATPADSMTAEIYDPATGTFAATGPFGSGSGPYVATATLLPDGRVLVVPFYYVSSYRGAGGIYDPATATFTPTGPRPDPPMGWQTANGSSVLLANGKVLLAGGVDDPGADAYTELYDPASGSFVPGGRLTEDRDEHTATMLPDGTVLVSGGEIGVKALSSAELYDAATDRFVSTGSMTSAHTSHTATLLLDGTVLIAGGRSSAFPPPSSSAEIYKPATLQSAPALFSLGGDGRGQGAIWNAATGQVASPSTPAVGSEILSLYTTSLGNGSVIPPQVAVGGRLAEILFFGPAPGYAGYYQVNFRMPGGIASSNAVPVRLTYLDRLSNAVTICVQ